MHVFKFRFILLIAILYLSPGCQEYYTPEVDAQSGVLIVEGIITDSPGPDSVRLSEALPYNEGVGFPAISGAEVRILDSENQVHILEERSPGIYYTSNEFDGVSGIQYVLDVETMDGYRYLSDVVSLQPVPVIDSMYPNFNTIEYLVKNLSGEYVAINDEGMDIFFDIAEVETENLYLKFEWIASIQYSVYMSFPTTSVDSYRTNIIGSMISEINPVVNIVDPGLYNSMELKRIHLGFFGNHQMIPTVEPVPGGTIKGVYPQGVVIFAWLRSIEESEFDYWSKVKGQIYADGKLFDPVNTRITGNIRCETDPSKLALGYFSASSVSNISYYAYLRSDYSTYSRRVGVDPDTMIVTYDTIAPAIWIWPEH